MSPKIGSLEPRPLYLRGRSSVLETPRPASTHVVVLGMCILSLLGLAIRAKVKVFIPDLRIINSNMVGENLTEESIRLDEIRERGERESIAESAISEQLIALIRRSTDLFKELQSLLKELDDLNKAGVEKIHGRIRLIKDEIEEGATNLFEYVVRVSPALSMEDLYVGIVQNIIRLAEHGEAAANRALLLVTKGFEKMSDNMYIYLDSMIRRIMEMMGTLIDMLNKLRNSRVVKELYQKEATLENNVDEIYRELGLEMIRCYSNDVGALLLLKELTDKLEDTADILKRVGSDLRLISLHR